ncbi:sulfatase-like hydrolase/transferase [Lacinutrix iliipiscaria]|uniref:Sulfatase-like hydrolase/transferase n=1 Tax=Lacinutrix iliipiscaria TaxID=1230532 RepID=A0ABW5WPX7_9FLAO
MFEWFQIVVLFFFSISILLLISHKIFRLIFAVLFSVFISLQCFSIYFGGSLIDLKFYKHLNFNDILLSIPFLWKQSITLLILILLFTLLFVFLHKRLIDKSKKIVLIPLAIISLVLMSFSDGVFNNLFQIIKLNNVSDQSLNSSLEALNINPKDYVYSDAIKAEKGKNIIIISLESFEKGFLGQKFKNTTPHLQRLKNDYSFFSMNQGDGSYWTSASMYTYITGVPMFFKGLGNEIFQNAVEAKLTGISHVLDKAGYEQLYLLGNPKFSGMSDLLNTYKINNFPQSYYNKKYGEASFGLHDYDLFNEAKEQVLTLKDNPKPFALYLSTISTHFPNGFYDKRMEKHIEKKESDFEFMVASVDYMLNDFIQFLETQGVLENTIFYIFPDHLLMGGNSEVVDKMDERKLFVLTNAERKKITSSNTEPIEQIDLPKFILDGAEIKHNAKFLVDFIVGDKQKYIENNEEKLLALNEASIRVDGFDEDFKITLKSFSDTLQTNSIKLKSHHKSLTFETDKFAIQDYRYHTFIFDDHMRVSHKKSNGKNFIYRAFEDKVNVLLDIDSTKINVFIRKGNGISKAKQYARNEIEILKSDFEDLKLIEAYGFESKKMIDNNFFKINNAGGTLFLSSSLQPELTSLKLDDEVLNHKRGLNLIVLDNPYEIENYDTHNGDKVIERFINRIKKLKANTSDFVIVSDNPVGFDSEHHQNELKALGLPKLAHIRYQQPYICYSESGVNIENVSTRTLSIQVNINNNQSDEFKNKLSRLKNDKNRFIAHAAGEIDGLTYTNSLEALDLNYAKGFRLFELDIIKTSDDKFVAAHDWRKWNRDNGFKKTTPVTHETFMATKIKDRFTPLSMQEINDWFAHHQDAILITDKVNSPKAFAELFVDKNRLIMELFSVKAVKEARENGVKFLAAPKVFRGMNSHQKLKFISENKIDYMSVSRKSINNNNKAFYKKLKSLGVKLYAYHVNFENWKDEKYVFLNEMDFIYGFYADRWFE